jgi:hypothetical protein
VKCIICDTDPRSFAWTDQHGIAQCTTCGSPYRIYHYEGEGDEHKRVEKPPELLYTDAEQPMFRRIFVETKARISAVQHGLSFPGGQDVATREDVERVSEWWRSHKHEYPERS